MKELLYCSQDELTAGFGYTYLSREDLPELGAGDFIDFTHLNEHGRKKFNSFLASYLRNEIRAGNLPMDRAEAQGDGPEQFGHRSSLALTAGAPYSNFSLYRLKVYDENE